MSMFGIWDLVEWIFEVKGTERNNIGKWMELFVHTKVTIAQTVKGLKGHFSLYDVYEIPEL